MTENFAELFNESYQEELFSAGSVVKATVVKIEKDVVYLDAGTKSEAYVDKDQFKNEDGEIELAVGDEVDMFLEMPVDGLGETRLSRDKAIRLETWAKLKISFENDEILQGRVVHVVKSGLSVDINRVRAFLPRSLVDTRGLNGLEDLLEQIVDVKIVSMDEQKNNLIVSRRAVFEEANKAEREALLSKIGVGDTVQGTVKNLTDYGAFIDLGGIDGLLHITDMAWKRITHPSEVVEIGQSIEVQILKLDEESSRLSLGMKQLQKDPWEDVVENYPVGSILRGCKVSNVTTYGAFVSVSSYIDGLVHNTELDWKNRNIQPNRLLSIGDEVDVKVIEIDPERRRMSLSIKQCKPNPWVEFSLNHKRGDIIKGPIRSKTDFGIFIGLDGNVDGLVHVTDLTWEKNPSKHLAKYKKDDIVEAVILSMDTERERMSLGIKQLTSDSFTEYVIANPKGTIVEGEVVEVSDKEATVALKKSVSGTLRKKEMIEELKVGDKVSAAITNIDKKNHSIYLSVKMRSTYEEKNAVKEYKQSGDRVQTNTIGDILGKAFDKSADKSTHSESNNSKKDAVSNDEVQ